jgi:predicted MFS family arabinose efflux permease
MNTSTEVPDAEPVAGQRRILIGLCAASFLASLNFLAMSPFYPQITSDLETTVPLLGQIATLLILISALLGLVVGPFADRYGFRWLLVFGMLAIAFHLIGVGVAPAFWVLLPLSLVGGLGDAIAFGLPLAIVGAYYSGESRRRAMGWTIGALSSGPIIGIPVLTTIGDLTSWRVALLTAGVVAVAVAWFVSLSVPPDRRRPERRFEIEDFVGAYRPLLRHPATLRLYGATAFRAVTWIGLLTYLGAFLGEAVGLSTRQIGLVYMLGGAGYAAGSVMSGGRLQFVQPRTMVVIGSVLGGVSAGAALLLAGAWTSTVLILVTSFAGALAAVGIATLLASETPAGIGTTMVFNGSILNFGSATGAALGGVLLAVGGYNALGLGLPVFALIAGLLAWWPGGRSQPATT